jgi:hypothetical protein
MTRITWPSCLLRACLGSWPRSDVTAARRLRHSGEGYSRSFSATLVGLYADGPRLRRGRVPPRAVTHTRSWARGSVLRLPPARKAGRLTRGVLGKGGDLRLIVLWLRRLTILLLGVSPSGCVPGMFSSLEVKVLYPT